MIDVGYGDLYGLYELRTRSHTGARERLGRAPESMYIVMEWS